MGEWHGHSDDRASEVAASVVQAPVLAGSTGSSTDSRAGAVLCTPGNKRGSGAMHLTTIGRKSGRATPRIVGYIDDGSTPVVLAMNGWDEGQPAWWLNLEAHPDAVIRLKGQPERPARAAQVEGDERDRLWRRWAEIDEGLDAYAGRGRLTTPVIVFEPRDVATGRTP